MDQKLNNSIISSNYDSIQRAPTSATTHAGLSSTNATTTFNETMKQSKLGQSICASVDPKDTIKTEDRDGSSSPTGTKNKIVAQTSSRTPGRGKSQQKGRIKRGAASSQESKPRTPFSRGVRLTTDPVSMDPKVQLKKLIKNKFEHLDFNPTLCNHEWRQHYQELFDNSQFEVDIKEAFVERQLRLGDDKNNDTLKNNPPISSKIAHPDDIHSTSDAIAYGRTIKPRKVFWQFHTKILSQEGTETVGMRSPEMIREGKEYILSHYHRTFGDKMESQGAKEPDYVSNFKYVEGIDVKAKLRALMKYGYDKEWEDQQLKKIQRDISISGDKVAKRLKGFGIISLEDVPIFDGIDEISEEETFRSGCSAEVRGDDLNDGFVPPNKEPRSSQLRQKIKKVKQQAKEQAALAAQQAKEQSQSVNILFRRPFNPKRSKNNNGRSRGAQQSMLAQTAGADKKLNNRVTFKTHQTIENAPLASVTASPKGTNRGQANQNTQGIQKALDQEIDQKWRQKSAPRGAEQRPRKGSPDSPGSRRSQLEDSVRANIQLQDYPFGQKEQSSRSKSKIQQLEEERMKLRSSEVKTRIKDYYKAHPELVLVSRHDDDDEEPVRARTSYQAKRAVGMYNSNNEKTDYQSAQGQNRNNFLTISNLDQNTTMSNTIQEQRGTQSGSGTRSQVNSPGGHLLSSKDIVMGKRKIRHKTQYQIDETLKKKYGRHLAANRENFIRKQQQIQKNNPKFQNEMTFDTNSRSGTRQTLTAASSSVGEKLGKARRINNYSQDIRGAAGDHYGQAATRIGKPRQLTGNHGLHCVTSTNDGSTHQQWKDSSQDLASDTNNINELSTQQHPSQQDFNLKFQNLMPLDDKAGHDLNSQEQNELHERTKSPASCDSLQLETTGGKNIIGTNITDESHQRKTSLQNQAPKDAPSMRHVNCKRTKKYIKAMQEKALQAQKGEDDKEKLVLAAFFPSPPKDYTTLSKISREIDQYEKKQVPGCKQQTQKTSMGTKKQVQVTTIVESTDPEGDVEAIIDRIGPTKRLGREANQRVQEVGAKLGAIHDKQAQSIERLDFIRGIRSEQQAEKEMILELMSEGGCRKTGDREKLRAQLNDQDGSQDQYFTSKMKEFKHYQKFQMAQDYNNLLRKDVIDKMAQERQENSLKLATMRGKPRIWRPDKFTLTKYGPKIKFN